MKKKVFILSLMLLLLSLLASLYAQDEEELDSFIDSKAVEKSNLDQTTPEDSDELQNVISKENQKRISNLQAISSPKGIFATVRENKKTFREISEMALVAFSNFSEKEIESNLRKDIASKSVGKYIQPDSKLPILFSKVAKDKKALPEMASILDKKDKLYIFLGVQIAMFLLSFFWAKSTKGIFAFFMRTFSMLAIRFSMVALFFYQELTPLTKLIWSVYKP